MLEQARLGKAPSPKRDSTATLDNVAESECRACASGTLGVSFGMVGFIDLATEVRRRRRRSGRSLS